MANLYKSVNSGIVTTLVCVAAPYLRSLSRVEMVVRRRPLSLLDSAVAIWYSSFSMEKGLAIRRHFRSCTIKNKSVIIPFNAFVGNLFMSQNPKDCRRIQ